MLFHCSTGDIFGYKVIEPFGTILFRTGDIVALSTVGSEMTPMCKATVNALFSLVVLLIMYCVVKLHFILLFEQIKKQNKIKKLTENQPTRLRCSQ